MKVHYTVGMSSFTWMLGSAGVLAMEGSYAPQLLRLYRLKRADEISYLFPGLNFCGRLLALSYSLLVSNQVFTWGFILGCTLRLALLAQVYWYRNGGRRPDPVDAAAQSDATPESTALPSLAGGALR